MSSRELNVNEKHEHVFFTSDIFFKENFFFKYCHTVYIAQTIKIKCLITVQNKQTNIESKPIFAVPFKEKFK